MRRTTLTSLTGLGIASLVLGSSLFSGCGSSGGGRAPLRAGLGGGGLGGGSRDSSGGVVQPFGALVTRVVGAAQPPVVSSSTGMTITGVAGASFTRIYRGKTTSRFAFVRGGQIWTMPADGGAPTQITTDGQAKSFPSWSPDGTQIAYISNHQINVIPATGGAPTPVNAGNLSIEDGGFSWSPDGSKFALATGQIYTVPATGGTPTPITSDNLLWVFVNWSPDGRTLAAVALDANHDFFLYTLAADGSGTPTQIVSGDLTVVSPVVSPDGSKVAYYNQAVKVVPVRGGDVQWLVGDPIPGLIRVSWSPDGTRISFLQPVGGVPQYDIQLQAVPADGGAPTVIGGGFSDSQDFAWSPFLLDAGAVPLLGDTGPLGAGTAAGFLYGQSGENVRNVLTFDTAIDTVDSRAKARVTTVSDPDSPVQVFLITSPDGLGRVAYSNFDSATGNPGPVVVPSLPAGTTSAVVVFTVATGKINSVAPYSLGASRIGIRRAVRDDAPQGRRATRTPRRVP